VSEPVGPGEELVDIVDDHDRVVDTVPRWRMRAERLRHRTVFIIVTSTDGRLLVHRRSDDKDLWPGRWDLAVGGVVGAGEDYADAARRELAEEVGVTDADPVPVGGAVNYTDDDVQLVGRCYRIVHDGPFTFADGEVVEARLVDRAQLSELLRTAAFVHDSVALLPLDTLFVDRPEGVVPTLAVPGDSTRRAAYDRRVQQLEFTVEPFVEGRPGPHVQAAVDAATAAGADVEFGPFGSTCTAAAESMPDIVAAVTRAAFAHGATHVTMHVAEADPR
jgi:isopentenyldiphosphate isomerase